MTRIVFLVEKTVDCGDLDLTPLRRLGSYRAYPDSSRSQVVSRAKGADIVITNKVMITEEQLSQLPRLRFLAVSATGMNHIDLEGAKKQRVGLSNVPGYSTQTVAEHALLFLLACSHRLLEHHRDATNGEWSRCGMYALLSYPYHELQGKKLGIVGYGAIGRQVARWARLLGMQVAIARLPGKQYPASPQRISLKRLLQQSDYVSIHSPLSTITHHLINKKTLGWMKRTAFLLNLARGPIVDEKAVAFSLKTGRLAGYATDVMEQEPPPKNHPFFSSKIRDKVLITPHIAWASRESRQRLIDEVAKNIEAFLKGKRRNRIV